MMSRLEYGILLTEKDGKNIMILHCMKKTTWETRKNKERWDQRSIETEGFIHCSTIEYF